MNEFAKADLNLAAKLEWWTLDEAIAYSLDKDPRSVNWRSMTADGEQYIRADLLQSEVRAEYLVRVKIAERAKDHLYTGPHIGGGTWLDEPTTPSVFLPWALRTFEAVPAELVNAVEAQRQHVARHTGKSSHASTEQLNSYSTELRAAVEAFQAVSADPKTTAKQSPKAALLAWLEKNRPQITSNARKRIATVANWQPAGGAPKTPG